MEASMAGVGRDSPFSMRLRVKRDAPRIFDSDSSLMPSSLNAVRISAELRGLVVFMAAATSSGV